MNDNNGGLYFIVGALVVVVGIGMYLFTGGHFHSGGGSGSKTTIEHSVTTSPGGDVTRSVTREKTN